jgi:hypothetical protein
MEYLFEKERKTICRVSFSTVFACIFFLTLVSIPHYWKNIIYEASALTWVESVILFSCSFISVFNSLLGKKLSGKFSFVWLLLSCIFLYLSLDERFMLHESIRERILKPNHFQLKFLFWMETGDYVLFIFMIAGLSILPIIFREIRNNKSALLFMIAGVTFGAFAVFTDSIDLHGRLLHTQYLIQYTEELFETLGMLCFFNSFSAKFFEIISCITRETSIVAKAG